MLKKPSSPAFDKAAEAYARLMAKALEDDGKRREMGQRAEREANGRTWHEVRKKLSLLSLSMYITGCSLAKSMGFKAYIADTPFRSNPC